LQLFAHHQRSGIGVNLNPGTLEWIGAIERDDPLFVDRRIDEGRVLRISGRDNGVHLAGGQMLDGVIKVLHR
jgi:hypothetical protein